MSGVRAVFLKDLNLLWPLAVLTAGLILMQAFHDWSGSSVGVYLPAAAVITSALFVLGLVQQDPPASLRHDWLTRPLPRSAPLAAKASAFALVVLLPAGAGASLNAVRDGASFGEAVLSAVIGPRFFLAAGVAALIIGTVSATVIEALGVMVALFLAFTLITEVATRVSGLSDSVISLGSEWVVTVAVLGAIVAGGLSAIWLQWGRRSTGSARFAIAGTLAFVAVVLALSNRQTIFSVQRMVTGPAPAATQFALVAHPSCVDAQWLGQSEEPVAGPWSEEQLAKAGPTPLAFWTAARPKGLPDGWRLFATHVQGYLQDRSGEQLGALESVRFEPVWQTSADGVAEALNAWLMSRESYEAAAPSAAKLRIEYLLALLSPTRSVEIPVDGRRRQLAGFGSCAATAKPGGVVEVQCFRAGLQPDFLTARPSGTSFEREVAGATPSFAPDILQVSPGRDYMMIIRPPISTSVPAITMTQYEARAHVRRAAEISDPFESGACSRTSPITSAER